MHVREIVEDVFNIGFFSTKMAVSPPFLIASRNKMMCICLPSCVVFVPSMNKIGPYMSEIWLQMHTCTHALMDKRKSRLNP